MSASSTATSPTRQRKAPRKKELEQGLAVLPVMLPLSRLSTASGLRPFLSETTTPRFQREELGAAQAQQKPRVTARTKSDGLSTSATSPLCPERQIVAEGHSSGAPEKTKSPQASRNLRQTFDVSGRKTPTSFPETRNHHLAWWLRVAALASPVGAERERHIACWRRRDAGSRPSSSCGRGLWRGRCVAAPSYHSS